MVIRDQDAYLPAHPATHRTEPTAARLARTQPTGRAAEALRHLCHRGAAVRGVGFEPTTKGLKVPCSTAELTPRGLHCPLGCAGGGSRTRDRSGRAPSSAR